MQKQLDWKGLSTLGVLPNKCKCTNSQVCHQAEQMGLQSSELRLIQAAATELVQV